jgi:hypothetical protein
MVSEIGSEATLDAGGDGDRVVSDLGEAVGLLVTLLELVGEIRDLEGEAE